MGRIVARSRELLASRGPESVAFHTSGQLFLEEYYTLAVLARAGIGTPHFVPFHYGYWDTPAGNAPAPGTPGRAVNEAIPTTWDPVSEQPRFKTAAAALALVERADDQGHGYDCRRSG